MLDLLVANVLDTRLLAMVFAAIGAVATVLTLAMPLIATVKSVCMALQQAERYGTPMAQTLRVMAQENRDMRMAEAEKKAAALPPKLTVPMILFFLPVLFVVILGPAAIRVMETMN